MEAGTPLPGDDWLAREFKQAISDWQELPPQVRPVYVPPAPNELDRIFTDEDQEDCPLCDTDTHVCPGCGAPVIHGMYACIECDEL